MVDEGRCSGVGVDVTCTRLCICRHSLYQRGAARNCRTLKLHQTEFDLQELESTTPTLSEPGSSTPADKHKQQNIKHLIISLQNPNTNMFKSMLELKE